MKKVGYLLLMVIISAALISVGCQAKQKKFLPSPSRKASFQLMAFYEKGWNDLTYGLPSLKAHYRQLDAVSPYWYTLTEGGKIIPSKIGVETSAKNFLARQNHTKLMPLINNAKTGSQMLTNPEIRGKSVDAIIDLVKKNNYDGVNIDFELIPPNTREGLTTLIGDLSKGLKPMKKTLSVSVFPKLDGLGEISAAYDYKGLAKYADFITLMTYDKHSEDTPPGSVAPIQWVEVNIKRALQDIPKEKLMITIGAYGYDWPQSGRGEYLGLRELLAIARSNQAKIQWDPTSQSPFFNYWKDGVKHTAWLENGQAVAKKVNLAKKYGLRGAAIWRLGFEDQDYWNKLNKVIK